MFSSLENLHYQFLNPVTDGAVLPILHLNGYKIAGPTVLARIPRAELEALLRSYGYQPYWVEGDAPELLHQLLAATLDTIITDIQAIQNDARQHGFQQRPPWPMLILKTPKGWTRPKEVDGQPVEGAFRAHQVPMGDMDNEEHIRLLENWMKSYQPEELFDEHGTFRAEYAALALQGERRMSANPHAHGGVLMRALKLTERTGSVPPGNGRDRARTPTRRARRMSSKPCSTN